MQGIQAKVIDAAQEAAIRDFLSTTRHPTRDLAMFLLSLKAGLRAKEIACVTWAMVTDASARVTGTLALSNRASKGQKGGRTIPLHPELQRALERLQAHMGALATPDQTVICSERGGAMTPSTVRLWFHRLYATLDLDGCSSHSGRRTFITRAARAVSSVGGSLRDVQELAGHSSLSMTQRYIDGDTRAKRALVALL
jgi:integrase/recombinase XerD